MKKILILLTLAAVIHYSISFSVKKDGKNFIVTVVR